MQEEAHKPKRGVPCARHEQKQCDEVESREKPEDRHRRAHCEAPECAGDAADPEGVRRSKDDLDYFSLRVGHYHGTVSEKMLD